MAGYAITEYLLDKENIHDTISKLLIYYDTRSEEGLANEVFAPEVHIDYSGFMSGEPFDLTAKEWSAKVIDLVSNYTSTQHGLCGLLIKLPQPGAKEGRPVSCEAIVSANGHLVKPDGKQMHNGGGYVLEMARLDLGEGQNPWRVKRQVVTKYWEKND